MQGKGRTILLVVSVLIVILAMMLLPTGSQAQKLDTTIVQDTTKTVQDTTTRVKVPEPSISVLLLIGIGVTSLVGYGLQHRKRGK